MDEKPKRGRPAKGGAKVPVTLRLHPDVVAAFRALDVEWRKRMEAALAEFIAASSRAAQTTAEIVVRQSELHRRMTENMKAAQAIAKSKAAPSASNSGFSGVTALGEKITAPAHVNRLKKR